MDTTKWVSYSELAWTEPVVGPPEEYSEETELYCRVIEDHSRTRPRTLLHLGCGAGGNDYIFKRHLEVTGVDISEGMLEIARRLNPDVTYHHGDMRTVRLGRLFDAVAIPDSIGYMTTAEDLRRAIVTACEHLKPGGVLLITGHVKEEFKQNNFVYTGSRGDVEITILENNYIPDPAGTTYEATIVYLIRRQGRLEIHTDRHVIGLFGLETWLEIFGGLGLKVEQMRMDHLYDRFVAEEGKYPLIMFVCAKP